jgi:hypothetical protein
MTAEQIAKVCHEANRVYCETLGDTSQRPWDRAEPWQRSCALKGVEFKLTHLEASDLAQREAWVSGMLADGWRYGPVRDAEQRLHPGLLPNEALPIEEHVKDALFSAIVKALAVREVV